MRRWLLKLGALLLAIAPVTLAQNGAYGPLTGGGATAFAGVPSGACSATQQAVDTTNGFTYSCNGGVWLKIGPGAGTTAFSTLTTSTNTSATMTVGTGASLVATGSGTINATAMSAAGLTGTLLAAQFPALTGDITTSAGSLATALSTTGASAASCGDTTHSCSLTVDLKGRISANSNNAITLALTQISGFASGTTNLLPKYTAAGTIGPSLVSDDGSLLSYTGASGFSSAADGVHPGNVSLVGNTTAVTPATNTFNIMGPNVASFVAYAWQVPNGGPAANTLPVFVSTAGGIAQISYIQVPHVAIADTAVTPGSYTSANITVAQDGSITAAANGASSGNGPIESWAGDGSDGAVTADGTTTLTCLGAPAATVYTLTRDCYFTTFVNNTSTTIKTANYRILAATSFVNNGTIQNTGGNGVNGSNAAGATGGALGAAATSTSVGSLPSFGTGKAGVAGATGVTTAATGAAGTAGVAASVGANALNSTTSATTVAGGAGGASVAGANAGGAGGAAASASGTATLAKQLPRGPSRAEYMYQALGVGYLPGAISGGSGSGGAGAGDGTNAGGGGGGSGGGGGPGGPVVLISPTITNSATGLITSTGGTGGNGGNGAAGVAGNAGGGGGGSGGQGGSGGAVVLVYRTLTETTAVTAAAGSGGSAGTAGAGAGTGSTGSAGNAGTSSVAGTIWRIALP